MRSSKQEKALEKWTYVVSKYTLDSLLKDRHSLLAEKKDAPPSDTATPAEVTPPSIVPELAPIPPAPAPASTDVLKPKLPAQAVPPPLPTPPTPPTPPVPDAPPVPATTNGITTDPPTPPAPPALPAPPAPTPSTAPPETPK